MKRLFKNLTNLISVETKYRVPVFCLTLIAIMQTFAFAQSDSPFYWSFGDYGNLTICLLMIITCLSQTTSFTIKGNFSLILCLISCFILEYIHAFGHATIFSILPYLTIIIFCCCCPQIKYLCFKLFRTIIICGSICGIVAVILFLVGIPPLSIEEYYTDTESAVYYNYGFAYLCQQYFEFRLCSLFNEPGMFGTFCALILAGDNLRINTSNLIIAIAGLFTFSAAYFILLFIAIVIKFVFDGSIKSRVYIMVILTGVIIGILYMANFDDNFAYIVERFTFEDGKLVADTRTHDSLNYIWNNVINDTNSLLFGYDQYLVADGSSSYKSLIIKHGIVGCIIIFLPLIINLFAKVKQNKSYMIMSICFLISIYQRPQIFNLGYFVILIGGYYYIKYNNENESCNSRRFLPE